MWQEVYYLAVYRFSGTTPETFHVFTYPYDFASTNVRVPARSISVPADSPAVISVGAVDWNTPTTIESYSSRGPNDNGDIKPDLVAPDKVSNYTYSSPNFAGTSASTPHVAGAAALIMDAYPAYTPAAVQSYLESNAVPLGASGKDNVFGSGILNLGAPPPAPGSISGRVAEDDNDPIANATVTAAIYTKNHILLLNPDGTAVTDQNGDYTINGLPAGNYRVCAVATGYERVFYDGLNIVGSATPVTVTSGNDADGINFFLSPGGTISGTVYNQSQQPLSGISVCTAPIGVIGITALTVTDVNGNYTLDGLAYGSDYQVTSPVPNSPGADAGYIMECWQEKKFFEPPTPIPVGSGGINFTLEVGGTISGHIQNSTGQNIAGAVVFAIEYDTRLGNWRFHGLGLTNTDGNYRTTGLPAGQYAVKVQAAPGYALEWWDNTYFVKDVDDPVTVTVPGNVPNINFTLAAGGTISGYVMDGSTAIQGAQVQIITSYSLFGYVNWEILVTVQTDQNGYYIARDLPTGQYAVRVSSGDYATEWYNNAYYREDAAQVNVTAPNNTQNINFDLEPGGAISGHVEDSDTHTPIPNIYVQVFDTATGRWINSVLTDASGNYRMANLPGGSYWVKTIAFATGLTYADEYYNGVYTQAQATPVVVNVPDETGAIDFGLQEGSLISGSVVATATQAGIPGALIQVIKYDTIMVAWEVMGRAWTDANGNYVTTPLPSGEYAIRVNNDNFISEWYNGAYYREDATSIGVTAPTDIPNINFSLEPGGSISGHVQNATGNPIPNLHVQAYDSTNGRWMTGVNTDASGNYVLSGLPGGAYWVRTVAFLTGLSYVDEWYNNVYSEAEATPVPVIINQDKPNINFSLDTVMHLPDLIISEVHEQWVVQGTSYKVYFTVKNIGHAAVAAGYDVSLTDEMVNRGSKEGPALNPNATWSSYFDTAITLTDGSDVATVMVDSNQERQEESELNNGRSATFAYPAKPDLTISEKHETWNGNDYTVHFTIFNQGNAPAPAGFDVSLNVDGTVRETIAVTQSLAKGATRDLSFTNPVTVTGGFDTVIVTADSNQEVSEPVEWNNSRENSFAQPPLPDLNVIFVNGVWVDPGNTYTVNCLIQNMGNAVAPAGFDISLAVDGQPVGTSTVPAELVPGQLWFVSFTGPFTKTGFSDRLTAVVDAYQEVTESREDNNSLLNIWPSAEPPTVTTGQQVYDITTDSANVTGSLITLGDYTPIYLSFVYGTVSQTDPANYPLEKAGVPPSLAAPGDFSAALTGLNSNTTYYFRAKATSGGTVGSVTAYGAEQNFTTAKMPPTVTTLALTTSKTDRSAVLSCNVTTGDYSPVYVAFDYRTTQGQYTANTTLQAVTQSGPFSAPISGLTRDTTYYFRARLTYDTTTIYGTELFFDTYNNPPEVWVNDDFDPNMPGLNVDLNFTTIQAGINRVEPVVGIVHVHDGTYTENITINKSITLQSMNGPAATVNLGATGFFSVTASYVNVIGLTITGSGTVGILLNTVNFCTVSDCIVSGFVSGITMNGANNARIKNNTIRNNTRGIDIAQSQNNEFMGNSFLNNENGIYKNTGVVLNVARFNNFAGNSGYGVFNNDIPEGIDARHNWWGDTSGPGGPGGTGSGDNVTAGVTFEPWLRAEVAKATSGTVTDGIVSALAEAGTEVDVTGTATIAVARYTGSPGGSFSGSINKYIDIYIENVAGVTEVEIRLYYTNAEIAGKVESSLKLSWWDGTAWVACSDTGVNMTAVGGYSGYIWARLRNDGTTTPSLTDLTGTPFGASGSAQQQSGGGGGGGGGGSSDSTSLSEFITGNGRFVVDATAQSADQLVKILIPKDTVGKDRNGGRLRFITIKKQSAAPETPADCKLVCLAYDIGPAGATLDPFAYLIFIYSDSQVPAGVDEANLVLATLQDGAWVMLEDCVVDPAKNTITAPIMHFSVYTAMARTAPASFEVAEITVAPAGVEPGATVMVGVTVTNTGDLSGSYTIALKINNVEEQTKAVTLKGGESQAVSFTVRPDKAGAYTVNIGGLSGQFRVTEPEGTAAETTVPLPPEPSPTPPPAKEPVTTAQPEPTEQPVVPAQIPQEAIPPSQPIAWWLIVVYAACAVFVVGVGVFLFLRRRNAQG